MLKKIYSVSFILLLIPEVIMADLAIMNDGSRISGYYIKETPTGILFKTLDGTEIEIARLDLKKLEVGYNGSSMCIQKKDQAQSDCSTLFYKMDKKNVVVVEGEGFLKLKTIPLDQVQKIEIKNTSAEDSKNTMKIPIGHTMEIQYNGNTIKGEVVSQDKDTISIKDDQGQISDLKMEQLTAAVIKPDTAPGLADFPYRYLYPGIYQYEQGSKNSAYGLFGGFSFAVVGFIYEYLAAVDAANQASSDPSVFLFNNDSYLNDFNKHQNMQKLYFLGASVLFVYNLLDFLYFDKTPPKEQSGDATLFLKTGLDPYPSAHRNLLNDVGALRSNQHYTIYSGLRFYF